MARHPLKGSERKPLPGAKAVGPADPSERLEVSVLLRRRNADALKEKVTKLARRDRADGHLSREEFEEQFGADRTDIAAVKKFAATHGLSVVQEHAGRRTVVLSGTVAQFNEAFGVALQRFEHAGSSYRGRIGSRPIAGRTARARRSRTWPRQSAGREAAFPSCTLARQCALARRYRRCHLLHAAATRVALRFPARHRAGTVRRDHRARWRRAYGGSERLFLGTRHQPGSESHSHLGRPRQEPSNRRSEWTGRRGDARYRSGRRDRAATPISQSISRPIPTPVFSTRLPPRSMIRRTSPRSSRSAGAARNRPGPSRR